MLMVVSVVLLRLYVRHMYNENCQHLNVTSLISFSEMVDLHKYTRGNN